MRRSFVCMSREKVMTKRVGQERFGEVGCVGAAGAMCGFVVWVSIMLISSGLRNWQTAKRKRRLRRPVWPLQDSTPPHSDFRYRTICRHRRAQMRRPPQSTFQVALILCLGCCLVRPNMAFSAAPAVNNPLSVARHQLWLETTSTASQWRLPSNMQRRNLCLHADPSAKKKKLGKNDGVYTRPSAAIERGSGFFIPGLEGPKIRLVVGLVLFTAVVINHVLSFGFTAEASMTAGNILAEGLAVVYSILVLLQAAVEAVQETASQIQIGSKKKKPAPSLAEDTSAFATRSWIVTWNPNAPSNDAWRNRVTWSAQTLLGLSAATQVMLIGSDGILYRLCKEESTTTQPQDDAATNGAITALQETLQASASGRVSLPPSHPASQCFAGSDQTCIVVQRISLSSSAPMTPIAWMVTSPNSLATTLSKRDLSWLGPLARYVSNAVE